ncbi:AraC-like DNA-binding protein/mannose-6-phosphate isomerase-like protein (cupin superfamily) [Lachnospiraceae bacterium PF1-21]
MAPLVVYIAKVVVNVYNQTMKKKLTTKFTPRQQMLPSDYEIFYYDDLGRQKLAPHAHDHYEFYYFMEGDLDYQIADQRYSLQKGDFMLIPSSVRHQALMKGDSVPYRRIILWLKEAFYEELAGSFADLTYGYDYAKTNSVYHFRPDAISTKELQGKLIELIETLRGSSPFKDLEGKLKIANFLAVINSTIWSLKARSTPQKTPLYLQLGDYITAHLEEPLTLDTLAREFYLSKYHLAHTFKEHMGITLHQYISQKRLQAIKNEIPTGTPITELAATYGFPDYTTFYRAFKKEYGLSPTEYKRSFSLWT